MAMTSIAPQVLPASGAFACQNAGPSTGAWIPTGVVTADLQLSHQGTTVPFAGYTTAAVVVTPRQRKNSVSGITSSSPPV